MRPGTIKKFKWLQARMAKAYGVDINDLKSTFAVTEPMEIKLNGAVQDSSAFLSQISMLPVTDKQGQSLRVQVGSTLAKRTDTSSNDRVPTKLGGPGGLTYQCVKTEFDVSLDYNTMDAWARFENFVELYSQAVYNRIALDRIMVGFNGTQAAAVTDPDTYPLLQDVNIGWLQLLADHAPENFLTESTAASGKITLGAAGDYKNLDQLAFDIYSMIPVADRSYGEVAIVGRALVANDMGKALADNAQKPSEKKDIQVLDKTYGGLPSIMVPGFPDMGLMVTDTRNLHLYYQNNGTRRKSEDNAKRDQVDDYISSNDAYSFGDVNGAAAVDASAMEFKDA